MNDRRIYARLNRAVVEEEDDINASSLEIQQVFMVNKRDGAPMLKWNKQQTVLVLKTIIFNRKEQMEK